MSNKVVAYFVFIILLLLLIAVGIYLLYGDKNADNSNETSSPTISDNSPEATTSINMVSTPASSPLFPATGGVSQQTQRPVNTPASTPAQPVQVFSIITPKGGDVLSTDTSQPITWSLPKNVPVLQYSEVRIEVISTTRVNKGPILVADYQVPIASIPQPVYWTIPHDFDTTDFYKVRITYKTSSTNYFGDAGYKGLAYVIENTQPFTVALAQPIGTLNVSSAPINIPVTSGAKNIRLLTLYIKAPSNEDGLITDLSLGSDNGNSVFNYIENIRIFSTAGTSISGVVYENEFIDGYPLYRLTNSLYIPRGTTGEFIVVGDLKPGVVPGSIPALQINNGRANIPINVAGRGEESSG